MIIGQDMFGCELLNKKHLYLTNAILISKYFGNFLI